MEEEEVVVEGEASIGGRACLEEDEEEEEREEEDEDEVKEEEEEEEVEGELLLLSLLLLLLLACCRSAKALPRAPTTPSPAPKKDGGRLRQSSIRFLSPPINLRSAPGGVRTKACVTCTRGRSRRRRVMVAAAVIRPVLKEAAGALLVLVPGLLLRRLCLCMRMVQALDGGAGAVTILVF